MYYDVQYNFFTTVNGTSSANLNSISGYHGIIVFIYLNLSLLFTS